MGKSLLTLALMAALTGAMLGGCTSFDKQIIRSSPSQPTTVTLIDSISHQPVWNYDIPVGHKMILDFDTTFLATSRENPGEATTHEMTWKLYSADAWSPVEQFPLSGAQDSGEVAISSPVRMVLSYRPPQSSGAVVQDLPVADTMIDNTSADEAPTITTADPVVVDEADAEQEAEAEATEPAQDEGM